MSGQPTAFSFTVDSFYISETRSAHQDTDFVSSTIQIVNADGSKLPSQNIRKEMGNVNNGTHTVGLTFASVVLSPGQTIVWNYSIVNAGNQPLSKIEQALISLGNAIINSLVKGLFPGNKTTPPSAPTDVASQAGGAVAAAAGAGLGISLFSLGTAVAAAVVGLVTSELVGLLTANCDGAVAAEAHSFTYDQLIALTTTNPFSRYLTQHPGTSSPAGCGANSEYWVDWHIDRGPYTFWGGASIAGGNLNRGGGTTTKQK